MDEYEVEYPREACGVVGIFGCPRAAELAYEALFSLQHRGQEGAGIVVSDRARLRYAKGTGLLNEAIPAEKLAALAGDMAVGHVRYSTTGGGKLQNVQPLIGECVDGMWAVAHNGNIVNAWELRKMYQEDGALFQTGTDTEIMLHLIADPRQRHHPGRIERSLELLRGSYAMVLMSRNKLIAARDPHGFKPLSLGRLGGGWVLASETCALTQIGAAFERDLAPGEVVFIDADGIHSTIMDRRATGLAHCVFELVYFARPDSRVFGYNVHQTRLAYGERLAEEHPVEADMVTAVPDSGNSAALGYSRRSGIPFDFGFIRNHYVGRTFIAPAEEERKRLVDRKLAALPETVAGRRIVVVDDSIVRGNTCRRRVAALRAAGAREVHLRIACPPVANPCYYGIDFPTRKELAAGEHSVEEVRKYAGADSLGYLSLEGLLAPFENPGDFCLACFDGAYPLEKGLSRKDALEK